MDEIIVSSEGKISLNITSIETKLLTRNMISKYDEQHEIWTLNDNFELIPVANGEISFISYLQRIQDLEMVIKRKYSDTITGEIKIYTEKYIYTITANNNLLNYSKQNILENNLSINKREIVLSACTCITTLILYKFINFFRD